MTISEQKLDKVAAILFSRFYRGIDVNYYSDLSESRKVMWRNAVRAVVVELEKGEDENPQA
jgi:hypothetical protein